MRELGTVIVRNLTGSQPAADKTAQRAKPICCLGNYFGSTSDCQHSARSDEIWISNLKEVQGGKSPVFAHFFIHFKKKSVFSVAPPPTYTHIHTHTRTHMLWLFCSAEVEEVRPSSLETHLVVIRTPRRYCDSCLPACTPARLLQACLEHPHRHKTA